MYYIVDTTKSMDQAVADLEAAVKAESFGVLHIHDIGGTLRSKGVEFEGECKVLEICHPKQAARIMASDMSLNMALPCRISVYTEDGKTRIGMIKPEQMLLTLSDAPALKQVAAEVEEITMRMIDAAR